MSSKVLAPLAGVLVVAAAVLAACGSSDSSTSSTTAAADTASGPCVTATKAAVNDARAAVPLKAPPSKLDLEALKGKNVWMILAAQTPFIQSIGEGFTKAAKAAGMTPHVVSTPGDVTQMNEGISRAVAQNADGISLMGVAPEAVAGPLSKAVAQGIPFVDTFATGAPDEPLKDSFAHVTADYNRSGRVLADWAMADSGCKAKMAILSADGPFPNLKAMVPAAQQEVKKQCPDCEVSTDYYDIGKIATELGSQTQSVLRRNPDTDYVFAVMDAGVQFVGPALQQAGAADKVKVMGHDGVDQNLDDIRKGGVQDADMAFVPAEWIGWATVDELGRAITGQKAYDWTIPVRLIDSTNVGSSNSDIFPAYDGFEQKFEDIWSGKQPGSGS